MASEFYTRIGNGKYELHFETDNPDDYVTLLKVARLLVDSKEHTNADRIRYMSDEELADELKYIVSTARTHSTYFITGHRTWLEWLQLPARVDV